jgi:hypothetical protein
MLERCSWLLTQVLGSHVLEDQADGTRIKTKEFKRDKEMKVLKRSSEREPQSVLIKSGLRVLFMK